MAEGQLLLFLCAICVTTRVRNFIVEVSYTRLDRSKRVFPLFSLLLLFLSSHGYSPRDFLVRRLVALATYLHLWRPLASSSSSISVLTENSCVRSIPGNVYRKTRGDSNEHKKAKKTAAVLLLLPKGFQFQRHVRCFGERAKM